MDAMIESDIPTACALCGQDPAKGRATTYGGGGEVVRLCHSNGPIDDADGTLCYWKWTLGERPKSVLVGEKGRSNR